MPETSRSAAPARVWLIGLMGAGKSTVGRSLAPRLATVYVDNDDTVAALAGVDTLALSQAGGELLHEWESRYAAEIAGRAGPLVAGIAASSADRPGDLALLAATGTLVYLRCDVPTLVRRVTGDPARPWLGASAEATLQAMFDRRDPALRAAADLVLDGAQAPEVLVEAVLRSVVPGEGPSHP